MLDQTNYKPYLCLIRQILNPIYAWSDKAFNGISGVTRTRNATWNYFYGSLKKETIFSRGKFTRIPLPPYIGDDIINFKKGKKEEKKRKIEEKEKKRGKNRENRKKEGKRGKRGKKRIKSNQIKSNYIRLLRRWKHYYLFRLKNQL